MPDNQTMWRRGKGFGSVVSDVLPPDAVSGSEDHDAYDGYLIAESVAPSLIPLVAAAPEMRDILRSYIVDDPCAVGDKRYIAACEILARIDAGAF